MMIKGTNAILFDTLENAKEYIKNCGGVIYFNNNKVGNHIHFYIALDIDKLQFNTADLFVYRYCVVTEELHKAVKELVYNKYGKRLNNNVY